MTRKKPHKQSTASVTAIKGWRKRIEDKDEDEGERVGDVDENEESLTVRGREADGDRRAKARDDIRYDRCGRAQ